MRGCLSKELSFAKPGDAWRLGFGVAFSSTSSSIEFLFGSIEQLITIRIPITVFPPPPEEQGLFFEKSIGSEKPAGMR